LRLEMAGPAGPVIPDGDNREGIDPDGPFGM
jgi:hypothetical protein